MDAMAHANPRAIRDAKALIKACVPHVQISAVTDVSIVVEQHVMADVLVHAMEHVIGLQK